MKNTVLAGAGLGLATSSVSAFTLNNNGNEGKRVGMIGLDTSHCAAFAKALNDSSAGAEFGGFKLVAAYPNGTIDIEEYVKKIPEFTKEVAGYGVEIVGSIEEMLDKVDVVLLTCIDGNRHLEQALPVLKAGKPLFIDKPIAASLKDTFAIFEAAKYFKVPVFSSSSLRYINGVEEIANGEIGKVLGAETFSPAYIEEHHPDLAWYGIHGIEILFTVMGTGLKSVTRIHTENTDKVVGIWKDNRIGTYTGIRSGKMGYGGTVFGENAISVLGEYDGYKPLLRKITDFFKTGIPPVSTDETLEIFAFIEAADESKQKESSSVDIESLMLSAKKSADKWMHHNLK